jgi:DNA-binding GntR family transcriptional regulator
MVGYDVACVFRYNRTGVWAQKGSQEMKQYPDKDRRIMRQSVPESLRALLQERILNGEFKEGDPLIQDAIAEEYDVSRMPVREALRQLEAVGLISMQTHRGAVVTTIPTEQIKELFELRAMLECDILAKSLSRISDQDIFEARLILEQLEAAYEQRNVSDWGQLNWAFHKRLYAAADRPQTLGILQGINLQTERYIRLHLILTNAIDDAQLEHRKLLQLCTLRDIDGGVAFLRDHILNTERALLRALRTERAGLR